ncbi:MAG: epoxyqueuosine reductase QueH [Paludibacteraceae bacterium]|nr:epoxyqueuosine reductase QueH [Paludibacteraceae bacterium]
MNQTNYQKKLDQIIEALTQKGEVPSLLLHSCCAPCSSYTLEYLSNHFQITVLYYNPNIYPEEEYTKRVEEQKRLINELSPKYPIQLITEEYHSEEFYNKVKGLEKEPEGGARCFVCYRLRMEHTAQLAKALGFDYFTTTLSISPLKNAEKINEIGEELGTLYEVKHLPSDFKKKGGYQRSIQLSKEHNLYRQNYCGCVFSKR